MTVLEIEELTAAGRWRTVCLDEAEARVALVVAAERLGVVAATPYAAEIVRAAARRARARTEERRGCVLIVDDDEAVARGITRMLLAEGWRPRVALSYADGWQALCDRWESVLVDLVLRSSRPETGADLARAALRAGVPRVVLMSGIANGAELETIRSECGAHAALLKSRLDRETLLEALRPTVAP